MPVVVVESPAKAKTIEKYLGGDYRVLASFGHVRDLPPKDGSVDPNDDFAMKWEVAADSRKHLKAIKDALKDAAEKLAEMGESQPGGQKDPSDAAGAANAEQADASQAKKGGNKYDDASVKAAKDGSNAGGIGVIMTASDTPQGAQKAGLGLGGGPSEKKNNGVMPDLGAALRKRDS